MAPGDRSRVDIGGCTGVHYVDTGMYDVAGYGSVYVIDAERPAVVDTGIGADYEHVRGVIEAVGIDRDAPLAVVVTHVHLDHAGGAGRLARDFPAAEVYVHEVGAPHLVDPERLVEGTRRAVGDQWAFYAEPIPVPEDRIVALTDGDRVDLGDRDLIARHVPGHAPHQVVGYSPADDAVFTADAAGIYVPGRDEVHPTSPPPNFDLEQALADVETVRALEPSTLCYAHFGPARADDLLAAYEAVLSGWVASVEAARADLGDDEAVVERFVDAVDTGDVWGGRKARAEAAMNVRGVLRYLDRHEDG